MLLAFYITMAHTKTKLNNTKHKSIAEISSSFPGQQSYLRQYRTDGTVNVTPCTKAK